MKSYYDHGINILLSLLCGAIISLTIWLIFRFRVDDFITWYILMIMGFLFSFFHWECLHSFYK